MQQDNFSYSSSSFCFHLHSACRYLATCGGNRRVNVFMRSGELYHEFALAGSDACAQLEWDRNGETLAVLQRGSSVVQLWDTNKKVSNLETNQKEPTFLSWSKQGPQLAIGTGKGNLVLYNHDTLKKIPILGKHSKAVTCGSWNNENYLALASADRMVTISDANGCVFALPQLLLTSRCHSVVRHLYSSQSSISSREYFNVCLEGKKLTVFVRCTCIPLYPIRPQRDAGADAVEIRAG